MGPPLLAPGSLTLVGGDGCSWRRSPTGSESDGRARLPARAGHLPKQGGDTTPGPPAGLPRQRQGTTPQMRGRYPDYDVLTAAEHWDAKIARRGVRPGGQRPADPLLPPEEEARH